MTNFERSNALQPASPPSSLRDIVNAFETLLLYGQGFYNNTVCDFIKAGAEFMARMSVLSQPDVVTCNVLALWINSKLGKFHSEIIASNLQTAARGGLEYTRKDDHMMKPNEALHQKQRTAQVLPKQPRGTMQNRPNPVHPAKPSTVRRERLDMLPKQGDKTLRMHGTKHFKPLALPADAKAYIDKNVNGLASEYGDL
ncbi:hypothetical protein PHMEG_00019765 [Phytophthora megakarya]|uniref:Uncharacterized protein n=1 Tax=Phytophthora megakarya TaxID=4795 RepID=A0A225VR70_9STRA|nr:hypothetical protein PHMEG_00019765 [Phytophthora megakarya]